MRARFRLLALALALGLLALVAAPGAWAQTGVVDGTVVDASTEEPLAGATVRVVGTVLGTVADAEGRFEIRSVPAGTVSLDVRFLGYGPLVRTDVVVRPGRATTVTVRLAEAAVMGDELVVMAGYYQRVDTAPTSSVAFTNEEIRRAPGAEQEVARVLSALPGVAARGETSQDLFVRGGSPSENGFYVDNIPIPTPQHFSTGDGSSFGPTGLLNTEFVESVAFSRGAFSAAYGGRLSSVVDVRYREGEARRVSGSAGINFAGGQAVVEGPLPLRRGSFFASARRSYLDLIAEAINTGGAPRFSDVQGKIALDLTRRHRLSVLNLYGRSRFVSTEADAEETGEPTYGSFADAQNTTGANVRSLWGRGFTNTSVSFSRLDEDNAITGIGAAPSLRDRSQTTALTARSVSRFEAARGLSVEFGAEAVRQALDTRYWQSASTSVAGEPQPAVLLDLALAAVRAGAFATAVARPLPRVTLSAGARVDADDLSGEVYLQPRASASVRLTPRLTANVAGGLYRQPVPLSVLAQSAANRDLPQTSATHLVGGIDVRLTPSAQLTVEAFDKRYRDVPQLAAGNPLGVPLYVLDARGDFSGALTSDGRASARGVELLVQQKLARRVYGLVSLAYVEARYRDADGVWRSRDFDTGPQASVVGGWKPTGAWEVSARWSYLGARPYTPVDASASAAAGREVLDVARFNGERLPAYHSLFLRMDRRFRVRGANLVGSLSLWNAYNRENVDARFWNLTEARVDDRTQFSLLPIVGLDIEF